MESIHSVSNNLSRCGTLASTLLLQLDNCTRENNNKCLLEYFEFLVRRKVFDTIEVHFLTVGHTHTDIGQVFGTTSRHLDTHVSVTLVHLHRELGQFLNNRTVVTRMMQYFKWSNLC